MLFLRFAPVIPKLTINIASPIVGVPFSYFFFGSFNGKILLIKRAQLGKHSIAKEINFSAEIP